MPAASCYSDRRQRLMHTLGSGIVLIPTAPERPRNGDSHHPYRFDSTFYYLTGFEEPEALLVLLPAQRRARHGRVCRPRGDPAR